MPEATLIVIFTTSLIVGYSGAMMPGSLFTVNVSETAKRGFWAGPTVISGHAIAEALIVLSLTFGLNAFLKERLVSGVIGVVGGAFLLWMGFDIAKSAWQGKISLKMEVGETKTRTGPALSGLFASIANPFWVMWWATVGAGYIVWSLELGPLGILAFYLGHILSDFSWYGLVSFIIVSGRRVISDPFYRGVLLVCGIFLMFLSINFVVSGVQFFAA